MRFDPTRLRAARAERTIEDVAYHARISWRTLYRWERGETTPTARDLGRIATVLGVTIESFYVEESA